MVRFFYKVDTQQKAKILRKVSARPYCNREIAELCLGPLILLDNS